MLKVLNLKMVEKGFEMKVEDRPDANNHTA